MTTPTPGVAAIVAAKDSAQGWELRPLAEVADILDSRRVPVNSKEREGRAGRVPYYGATGQVGWIDDYLFDEELALLGEDGAPFLEPFKHKAYVIRGRSWVNNHAHVLRAREVPTGWLVHYLNTISYEGLVTGTTRLKLTQAAMRKVRVPVAPRPVMERIVAEIEKQFSRLDKAVTNLKRVKANLKRYRASVLKAVVEGRLVPTEADLARREGRTYETGEQLLARILKERRLAGENQSTNGRRKKYVEPQPPETGSLPELPEGWTWASVEQVGRLQLGRQRAPKYHQGQNMRPYLRVQNVFEARVDLADVMEMDFPGDDFETYKLRPGDILLNEGQSPELLGRPAIYRGEIPGACFTNTLIRFQAANSLDAEFGLIIFRHYMRSRRFTDEGTITTNIAHLSLGRLKGIEFPVPPLPEQHRIVGEVERRLSMADESEAQVDANLRRAERLRRAILKRAFEGNLG